ncbi:MAG: hypothetical protein F6K41_26115 [Symploca sp. SIO3E6]|nr:hypothetical protein [Caldora sp. SIO3E6]
MQLEGNKVTIDSMEYFIDNAAKILGILHYMVNEIFTNKSINELPL